MKNVQETALNIIIVALLVLVVSCILFSVIKLYISPEAAESAYWGIAG